MEKLKGFVAGFVFAIVLSAMTLTVFAGTNIRELIFGVNISVGGVVQEFPADQQPFIIDNRVFLSIRGISELLGVPIYFDEETNTVHIGGRPFPADMLVGEWQLISIVEYWHGEEDYIIDISDFYLKMVFFADGTGYSVEDGYFVEYFDWYISFNVLILIYDDGEEVGFPVRLDENLNFAIVFDMWGGAIHYYFERIE